MSLRVEGAAAWLEHAGPLRGRFVAVLLGERARPTVVQHQFFFLLRIGRAFLQQITHNSRPSSIRSR